MDWNTNNIIRSSAFVSRPPPPESSFNFLYNYHHHHDHLSFPGMNLMKHPEMELQEETSEQGVIMTQEAIDKMMIMNNISGSSCYNNQQDYLKKKRLTNDQLESLEKSFQEEIKLDPNKKMKLSRELGLQPRQIAVWFQNRRARWKAKQLEQLYDSLKQEFDVVTKEKQKLQEEVMKLQAILRDEAKRKPTQYSTGYTEAGSAGEETAESASAATRCNVGRSIRGISTINHGQIGDVQCNYLPSVNNNNNNNDNVAEYNPVLSGTNYWVAHQLPGFP